MSVIPMQKVRLLVHATDVDAALDSIQRAGAMEFTEADPATQTVPELAFPNAELLPRLEHAVNFVTPYAPAIGLWKGLREGTRTALTEAEVSKKLSDTDAIAAVVTDLEKLQGDFAVVNESIRTIEEQHDLLETWKELPIKLADLETPRTKTLLVQGHQATAEHPLQTLVAAVCTEGEIDHAITVVSDQAIALTLPKDKEIITKVTSALETIDAEVVSAPNGTETPDVEYVAISEKLAAEKGKLGLLIDQAEHFAQSHIKDLRVAAEILEWQKDRFGVLEQANATTYTVSFDGWLDQTKQAEIEAAFAEQNLAAVFSPLELAEGEEPPVDIRNSSFIQPFETVTRLYGMPGYTDLDPTIFLAAFFFLFFGLSLTDVGYGLALVLGSGFILTMTKVDKGTRVFAKLLLYVGIATVLVGMLFGGYFGVDTSMLPAPLQAIQMFDPIGNPLPVFYLALSLGVLQIMVGMIVKIYSEFKNKQLVAGILDQGPWLFLFTIGIIFVLTSVGYTDVLSSDQIGKLAILAAVLIFVTAARHGAGIFGKIISGLAGLYGGVGYFSDILSYSRLLALGLATSALAFAVNLIAGMLSEVPYVGFILTAVILFVGHMFTLVLNLLGAFVHSARLQFVEFFGKFISGTGKEFSPLKRSKRYITIGDD